MQNYSLRYYSKLLLSYSQKNFILIIPSFRNPFQEMCEYFTVKTLPCVVYSNIATVRDVDIEFARAIALTRFSLLAVELGVGGCEELYEESGEEHPSF